jgi:hypothetical protein
MNTIAPLVKKDLPLHEQLSMLRTEINALDPRDYIDANREIVSRFRQNFANAVFCYNEWDKNRDYSSVIHASMALGKLLDTNEMMAFISGHRSEGMNKLREEVNRLGSVCWDNIRAATGRIVPFE